MGIHPSIIGEKRTARAASIVSSLQNPKLNRTEQRYRDRLELMKRSGGIVDFKVQQITLKIADDCRYTCDFSVINNDYTITLVDVKGFEREDAVIKMKCAAQMFPEYRFEMVEWRKGEWNVTRRFNQSKQEASDEKR